jgi:hypothetical protein
MRLNLFRYQHFEGLLKLDSSPHGWCAISKRIIHPEGASRRHPVVDVTCLNIIIFEPEVTKEQELEPEVTRDRAQPQFPRNEGKPGGRP